MTIRFSFFPGSSVKWLKQVWNMGLRDSRAGVADGNLQIGPFHLALTFDISTCPIVLYCIAQQIHDDAAQAVWITCNLKFCRKVSDHLDVSISGQPLSHVAALR